MVEPDKELLSLADRNKNKLRVWSRKDLKKLMRYRGWFKIYDAGGDEIFQVVLVPYGNPVSGTATVDDQLKVMLTQRAKMRITNNVYKNKPLPANNKRNLSSHLMKIKNRAASRKK